MAFIEFPDDLPAPRAGTQYELEQPLFKGLEGARESYALISPFVPVYLTVEWIFTDEQAQRFEQFYQDDLADGMLGFVMPVLVPAGRLPARCRFLGIYEGPKLFSMPHAKERLWTYTAKIEMQQRIFVDVLTSKGLYMPIIPPEFNEASAVLTGITTRKIMKTNIMPPELSEASAVLNTITYRKAVQIYIHEPELSEASAVLNSITHVRRNIIYRHEPELSEASAVLNTITVTRK